MPQSAADMLPLLAPELAGEVPAAITLHLELAEQELSATVFGDAYPYAQALLAAHWLTLSKRGGAGGALTSEREGQLAASYAVADTSNDWATTSYGQRLLALSRSRTFGPRTRMTGVIQETSL